MGDKVFLQVKLRPIAEGGASFEKVGRKACQAEQLAWANVWRQEIA